MPDSGVISAGASADANAAEDAVSLAARLAGLGAPTPEPVVQQEHREYVNLLSVDFGFAAAWPTLFIAEDGDVPADFRRRRPRVDNPSFALCAYIRGFSKSIVARATYQGRHAINPAYQGRRYCDIICDHKLRLSTCTGLDPF